MKKSKQAPAIKLDKVELIEGITYELLDEVIESGIFWPAKFHHIPGLVSLIPNPDFTFFIRLEDGTFKKDKDNKAEKIGWTYGIIARARAIVEARNSAPVLADIKPEIPEKPKKYKLLEKFDPNSILGKDYNRFIQVKEGMLFFDMTRWHDKEGRWPVITVTKAKDLYTRTKSLVYVHHETLGDMDFLIDHVTEKIRDSSWQQVIEDTGENTTVMEDKVAIRRKAAKEHLESTLKRTDLDHTIPA